jgi:biopolymer transport protein ExbB
MSFDLLKIFREMNVFARLIAGALGVMAVASLAVFIERLWWFRRSAAASRRFAALAVPLVEHGQHSDLLRAAETHAKASPLASLLGAGLKTYLGAVRRPSGAVGPIELMRRELARRGEAVAAEVRRGMSVLASTGSVAPFVGLLGTVVGIISAFQGIAREGSGGLGAVSAGIAEALVVTALGLVVAIPAVLAFNFLSTRADAILLALDRSRGEFVDAVEAGPPADADRVDPSASASVPAAAAAAAAADVVVTVDEPASPGAEAAQRVSSEAEADSLAA